MVLQDAVGAEGVERPVLQEDVDRPRHRRGPDREHPRGLQLVVGAGEQHHGEAIVGAHVVPLPFVPLCRRHQHRCWRRPRHGGRRPLTAGTVGAVRREYASARAGSRRGYHAPVLDLWIASTTVVDGTGAPAFGASVGVDGGRVVAIERGASDGEVDGRAHGARRRRPGARARLHRRAQPLRRLAAGRSGDALDDPARRDERGRRQLRHVAVPGGVGGRARDMVGWRPRRDGSLVRRVRGVPRSAGSRSARRAHRRPGRPRIDRIARHGLGAARPVRRRARGDAAIGGRGDGCGRRRPVDRPHLRAGHLLRDRRGGRAGRGSRERRRHLRLAHPRRGRPPVPRGRRGHRDRAAGADPGAREPSEVRDLARVGTRARPVGPAA